MRAIRPRPALPVPDYLARLDDPVNGLRVGVDETVIARCAPATCSACSSEVLAILGKLGLQRAACRFPDWQTLDHLVQLVQMPDASAAHDAYLRTRAQRLRPAGARPPRGRPFHSAPSIT